MIVKMLEASGCGVEIGTSSISRFSCLHKYLGPYTDCPLVSEF